MSSALFRIIVLLLCFPGVLLANEKLFFEASLGPGLFLRNNHRQFSSVDSEDGPLVARPIPAIYLRLGRFRLRGRGVELQAYRKHKFSVSLNTAWGGDRYKADGLDPRYGSLFSGLEMNYGLLRLSYARDVMGRSEGTQIQLLLDKFFLVRPWLFIKLRGGIEFLDKKFMRYYYAVQEHEVVEARPVYDPGVGLNFPLHSSFIFTLNQHWTISTHMLLRYFGSQIEKSPTVTKHYSLGNFTALSYKFK